MSRTLGDIESLESFSKRYFKWICDKVDPNHEYSILMHLLFQLEFVYFIPFDENRAEDGRYVRLYYEKESGDPCLDEWLDWPCSILELVYALAIKIDDMYMYDISVGERVDIWFWEMLANLGLDRYTDQRWRIHPQMCTNEVSKIIDDFCNRRYSKLGERSLFPMGESTPEDWNKTELWGQMNRYFTEK